MNTYFSSKRFSSYITSYLDQMRGIFVKFVSCVSVFRRYEEYVVGLVKLVMLTCRLETYLFVYFWTSYVSWQFPWILQNLTRRYFISLPFQAIFHVIIPLTVWRQECFENYSICYNIYDHYFIELRKYLCYFR